MECLPNLCASMSSVVKILNVHFNRENVRENIITTYKYFLFFLYKFKKNIFVLIV